MLRNKIRIGKSYYCSEVEREVRVQTTVQPNDTVGICFETDFGEPYTMMVFISSLFESREEAEKRGL